MDISDKRNILENFMHRELENLRKTALEEISKIKNLAQLDSLYLKYFGRKKGQLNLILRGIKDLPEEERPKIGKLANEIKKELEEKIRRKRVGLSELKLEKMAKGEWIDVTQPGILLPRGYLHPITQVRREIEEIFQSMGFEIVEGPEVEKEYYNFDALNIPKYHPARDMYDTFWLENGNLLRTHTSPVQIRVMEKRRPPLRIIAPGRCFRYEAIDASHEATFSQIEGLMVGENISLSNLKATLNSFIKRFFGQETRTRFRPGYFPFVEPGFELDMTCTVCYGDGCPVCKGTGWIEIIPCGMVHPNVLKNVKYDPKKFSGFAFGMGLDRIVMMKYRIDDIRLFYKSDLRFLRQF